MSLPPPPLDARPGMAPRDVQDARHLRRWNENPFQRRRDHDLIRTADTAPAPLFRSTHGCLTHITRFVSNRAAFGECGTMIHNPEWINPADEVFGCHRCIAACEKYQRPTHRLIPDTGCSATDGARYRPRADR